MDLLNESPFQVVWMTGKLEPPAWSATFIVKAGFRLRPGAAPEPLEEPLDVSGDVFEGDDPARALLYPSDAVYFKPRADLLFAGTFHAPGGRAVDVGRARFRVGRWSKDLAVVGDRTWRRFGGQSEPRPFKTMPLAWERAFGGPGFARNPVGLGAADLLTAEGRRVRPLPNLENPARLIVEPGDDIEPAGVGPLSGAWPQRMAKAGTFGKAWQAKRWPWYPEDFDWGYFNAAPADQQVPFLKGDEDVEVENLHPAHPKIGFRLPGLRIRCFVEERRRATLSSREVSMSLDTLFVDMDRERLVLVWRGRAPVLTQTLDDLSALFVTAEPIGTPDADAAAWQARIDDAKEDLEDEDEELEPEEEEPEEEAEPPVEAEAAETPPPAPPDPEPEPEDAPAAVPEEPPPPGEEELRGRLERRESLAGLDLTGANFAGLDLAGLDFKETILQEASLAGARLAGADFTGAALPGADLRGAGAEGAVFAGADLAGARLHGADLRKTDLSAADLSGADLSRARLQGANLAGAVLSTADLSDADLTEAVLDAADLVEARLHRAVLEKASLKGAVFERAWGRGVRAKEADLTKLQAAEAVLPDGDFTGVRAAESVWEDAQLEGAAFAGAILRQAELSGARLAEAVLDGADLREAVLDGAVLTRARARRASFFGASIQKADLTGADLSESNLYGATCWDALTSDARLTGANLKMAKFGQGA